jgi:hypothetical protein
MTGMPTTTHSLAGPAAETDFVSTSFESCADFAPAVDGSPACDTCGWLLDEHEHDHAVADVHALPGAVRAPSLPKRLAS